MVGRSSTRRRKKNEGGQEEKMKVKRLCSGDKVEITRRSRKFRKGMRVCKQGREEETTGDEGKREET